MVSGGCDENASLSSIECFVERAKRAEVPLTYWRIEDMDHFIRFRQDVINRVFDWLKEACRSLD